MKTGARSFGTLALSLAIFAVLILVALGIKRVCSDEITGLNYIGPAPTVAPLPNLPAGASDTERMAYWLADSLARLDEPPIDKVGGGPDAEVYRFLYEPRSNPWVCVTIWREGNRYQMRTVVLYGRSAPILSGKTETISARKWNRLRTAFTKHSVTDPYDEIDLNVGIYRSSWFMQSLVSGRVTVAQIPSPVRSFGPPHFQIIKSQEPQLDDFVKTAFLFLDWAGVHMPEMY